MRILCLSDLHGHLPDPLTLPTADLILMGGDYASKGATPRYPELDLQKEWFESKLGPWLGSIKTPIISIAGNHDFLATYPWGERTLRSLPWTYLRDQTVDFGDLVIHGSPWSPPHVYGLWAFQADDKDLKRHWQKIPRDCNLLLVHTPAMGMHDRVDSINVGSQSLLDHFRWRKGLIQDQPLIVCGHIHEGAGKTHTDSEGNILSVGTSISTPKGNPKKQAVLLEGSVGAWKMTKHPITFLPESQMWIRPGQADLFAARLDAERRL